jgi:hypothetical protein
LNDKHRSECYVLNNTKGKEHATLIQEQIPSPFLLSGMLHLLGRSPEASKHLAIYTESLAFCDCGGLEGSHSAQLSAAPIVGLSSLLGVQLNKKLALFMRQTLRRHVIYSASSLE